MENKNKLFVALGILVVIFAIIFVAISMSPGSKQSGGETTKQAGGKQSTLKEVGMKSNAGSVSKIENGKITITAENGDEKEYTLTDKTNVFALSMQGAEPKTLSDIQPGTQVSVQAVVEGQVSSINILGNK